MGTLSGDAVTSKGHEGSPTGPESRRSWPKNRRYSSDMSQLSVAIWLQTVRMDGPPWWHYNGPLEVLGEADERFYDALRRAYAATGRDLDDERSTGGVQWLDWNWNDNPTDSDIHLMLEADVDVTMQEVADSFGEYAHDDPPTISINTEGGRGGEVELIAAIAGGVLNAYGTIQLAIQGQRAALALLHRKSRDAINRWEDTGNIDMDLRQLVLAKREWDGSQFQRQFGVTREQAGRLLRELGYTPQVLPADRRTWWTEPNPDQPGAIG